MYSVFLEKSTQVTLKKNLWSCRMHEIKATDNLFSELSTVVQIKAEMQGSNPGPDAQSAQPRRDAYVHLPQPDLRPSL